MEEFEFPKDLKKTKQRVDVYYVLSKEGQPMTAIEIYDKISKRDGGCSYAISTIYRTLAAFEEKGYVEKSTMTGEDMAVFEWRKGDDHRHYAICLNCHKKVALEACPFKHMHITRNTPEDDFTVTGHKLELYGYCKECRELIDMGDLDA